MLFFLSALETEDERTKLTYYYEKYGALLAKIAMEYLNSHSLAEDAVHNTFLTIIKNKEKILSLPEAKFRNWCVIIVRSRCVDILRRNKHYNEGVSLDSEDAPELASEQSQPDEIVFKNEQASDLERCLPKLSLQARTILEMKYLLGMSFTDICKEMNMTFDQVNGILRRARVKMKSLMESEG
jgi:RNA polymerase sigma-70 factor (ECF subfamily)